MFDLRTALADAGIRPFGHDPRDLTDDELDDAVVALGATLAALQRAAAQTSATASYAPLGAAMRAVAAYVPDQETTA